MFFISLLKEYRKFGAFEFSGGDKKALRSVLTGISIPVKKESKGGKAILELFSEPGNAERRAEIERLLDELIRLD